MARQKNLSTNEIVDAVTGTVEDLKNFINQKSLEADQLEDLEKAEKNAKNRETAVEFLRGRQNSLREEAKIEEAEKDIREAEQILEEFNQTDSNSRTSHDLEASQIMEILSKQGRDVQNIIETENFAKEDLRILKESEKSYKNRKSVLGQINKELEKIDSAKSLSEAERQIHSLEKNLSSLEGSSTANLPDKTPKSENESTKSDQDQEESRGTGSKTTQEDENETDTEDDSNSNSDPSHKDGTGEDQKEEHKEAEGSRQENDDHPNTKGSNLNSSGKTEPEEKFTEEEAQDMLRENPQQVLDKIEDRSDSYEQKMEMKEEIRSATISNLEDDFGREKLEEVSTRDLLKLRSEIKEEATESGSENSSSNSSEKDKEEMEKEAEEDLQMLMGAGLAESQSEEGGSHIPGIESLKDQIKGRVSGGTDKKEEEANDHKKINSGQVLDLLDEYRELPEKEATVKAAHVMKGYLEYAKKVDRELTYSELADKLDDSREDEEKLAEYFSRISKSEYTGNMSIKSDKFIDTSVKLVKRL